MSLVSSFTARINIIICLCVYRLYYHRLRCCCCCFILTNVSTAETHYENDTSPTVRWTSGIYCTISLSLSKVLPKASPCCKLHDTVKESKVKIGHCKAGRGEGGGGGGAGGITCLAARWRITACPLGDVFPHNFFFKSRWRHCILRWRSLLPTVASFLGCMTWFVFWEFPSGCIVATKCAL